MLLRVQSKSWEVERQGLAPKNLRTIFIIAFFLLLKQTHKVVVEIARSFRSQNLGVYLNGYRSIHMDRWTYDRLERSSCFVICLTKGYAKKADNANQRVARELNWIQAYLDKVVFCVSMIR